MPDVFDQIAAEQTPPPAARPAAGPGRGDARPTCSIRSTRSKAAGLSVSPARCSGERDQQLVGPGPPRAVKPLRHRQGARRTRWSPMPDNRSRSGRRKRTPLTRRWKEAWNVRSCQRSCTGLSLGYAGFLAANGSSKRTIVRRDRRHPRDRNEPAHACQIPPGSGRRSRERAARGRSGARGNQSGRARCGEGRRNRGGERSHCALCTRRRGDQLRRGHGRTERRDAGRARPRERFRCREKCLGG